jgi:hypothetical protein
MASHKQVTIIFRYFPDETEKKHEKVQGVSEMKLESSTCTWDANNSVTILVLRNKLFGPGSVITVSDNIIFIRSSELTIHNRWNA